MTDTDNNLSYWKRFSTPPEDALKRITGGRLKGMTDINPQWRIQAMTEVFGPCGIGWKYTIDKLWTEGGDGVEVLAFALVSVCIKVDGEWSDPIPGIGGNKLVEDEKRGPHNNDEVYKMAVTDALSVAFKSLGVASDIYQGRWDGSKYNLREDFVTPIQLNSLKLKWNKVQQHEEGLDREEKQNRFSAWCLEIVGEQVDYLDPRSWEPEWYQACWKQLGNNQDVPFEE